MYLNQKALYQATLGANKNSDLTYELTTSEINVRKQPHVEEVKDRFGKSHFSKHVFYTRTKVFAGDKLDGEIVVAVYGMNNLGGKEVLRRCITI